METNQTKGHLAAPFDGAHLGHHLHLHQSAAGGLPAGGDSLFRFLLGLAALYLVLPRPLRGTTPRQELTFAGAGLCGICLYYLLENIALTDTLASNVGVIVSVSPFFTAPAVPVVSGAGGEAPGHLPGGLCRGHGGASP